jgi:hypothetical protein
LTCAVGDPSDVARGDADGRVAATIAATGATKAQAFFPTLLHLEGEFNGAA